MLIVAYLGMTNNFVGNPLKESSTGFCICEESVHKTFRVPRQPLWSLRVPQVMSQCRLGLDERKKELGACSPTSCFIFAHVGISNWPVGFTVKLWIQSLTIYLVVALILFLTLGCCVADIKLQNSFWMHRHYSETEGQIKPAFHIWSDTKLLRK